MTSMLCLLKEHDLEAALSYLEFSTEEKPTLLAAARRHIELQSVKSRILSLRNLSSHAQKN